MRALRVLGPSRPGNAAFYYRVVAPFGVLDRCTEHEWKVKTASEEDVARCDVLWLQQHADYASALTAVEARLAGKMVVYDVDDWLFEYPPSWVDSAGFSERVKIHRRMLEVANVVTASTPYLAGKLRTVVGENKPIVVLPNCVLQQDWDTVLPQGLDAILPPGHGPVLGWFGTGNHWDDWMEIAPAVAEALEAVDGWLVLIGPASLAYCFPDELVARTRHIQPVSISQFAQVRAIIKSFDVGLAWATGRTEASRCRSPLKAYQYGAAGVPCVVSSTVYGEEWRVESGEWREERGGEDGARAMVAADLDRLCVTLVTMLDSARVAMDYASVRETRDGCISKRQGEVLSEHSYETQAVRWLEVLK